MPDTKPAIQFLIHCKTDTVGVATVDIRTGQAAKGLYMDTQDTVDLLASEDIPLGHKIALKDHKVGDNVVKYGHDIGEVVAEIKKAQHVHVHNLRTKRW